MSDDFLELERVTTLREYIDLLQALEKLHGPSIEVRKWTPARGLHTPDNPHLAHKRLRTPAEIKASVAGQFWNPNDGAHLMGKPVIRI